MAKYDIVEKYGVKLKRLTEDKIELVRRWRNDPKIQQYMEYREHITAEQQLAWFRRIDNENNYYFIIEYDGEDIGLINIKDIDYKKSEGETGIFIWDDKYLETEVPFRASLCLDDFIDKDLNIKSQFSHVLRTNSRAIAYNKGFGFELLPGQENVINQKYLRNPEKVKKFKERVIKYFFN